MLTIAFGESFAAKRIPLRDKSHTRIGHVLCQRREASLLTEDRRRSSCLEQRHRASRRIAVDLPVRSNPPGVTCGVDETTLAFVIRLIFYGSDLPGPKLEGSLENGVNVL